MKPFSTLILNFTLLLATLGGKNRVFSLSLSVSGSGTTTFTMVNRCNYTLWPGILVSGNPMLNTTGFELPVESSLSFQVPKGVTGRFWARTGCIFHESGSGSCLTGDCGSGQAECNGAGYSPSTPVTIFEFKLDSNNGQDFYDVSLVDGFNVPVSFEAVGGSGTCGLAGCSVDVNRLCPDELVFGEKMGCNSPCQAFGSSEYCCIGRYSSPETCKPNVYSEMFKAACPRAYSYAYDDADATFTCTGANYVVTFCPSSSFSSN